MDAEEFLNLFDSYWFHKQILTKNPSPSSPPLQNPPLKIEIDSPKPEISRLPSRHVRSLSDQLIANSKIISALDTESPKSVLFSHKLQPILSGKQSSYEEEEEESIITHKKEEEIKTPISSKKSMFMKGNSKRRNRGSSKSLSDLEFDELKGFMDLGFVFSEEDKNSSTLVSIIPGLQRLGDVDEKSCTVEIVDNKIKKGGLISRPYLSEAWKIMGQRKEEKFTYPSYPPPPPPPLMMNWRVPALGNEIDMKDQLKCWAHSVASTVR